MTDERQREQIDGDAGRNGGPVRAHYEWKETLPSTAIVETIATATDSEPSALEPLYDSIDPDALNVLLTSVPTPDAARDLRVSLSVDGHQITVYGDGEVVVRPDAVET